MAVTAAVSVSADFATVDKYGFFYSDHINVTQLNVGDTIPLNKNPYSARWSVSGLSPDYTYDIFLDILTDSAIDFTKLSTTSSSYNTYVYYSINNPDYGILLQVILVGVYYLVLMVALKKYPISM